MRLESCSDILTVEDLQAVLKIGRNTAYDYIKSGEVPSFRVGRQIRIYKKALEEALYGKAKGAGMH